MGAAWGGGLIQKNNRPSEELKRVGSPEVKISEPVPEDEDSKVTVISGYTLVRSRRMSFISYRKPLLGVFCYDHT